MFACQDFVKNVSVLAAVSFMALLPSRALAQDAAPVASGTYDLRAAPAPVVGDTTRRRVRLLQSGAVLVKSGDKQINQQDRLEQGYDLQVVEQVVALAADGAVERVLRTYEDASNLTMQGPFEGLAGLQVLVVEKPDGSEALAKPDGTALDERTLRLLERLLRVERVQRVPVAGALLPDAPVAPGERWRLSSAGVAELLALTGVDILNPAEVEPDEVLEASATFERVETKDGVALLHVAISLRLAIGDLEGVTFDAPADVVITARYVTAGAAAPTRSFVAEGTFKGTLRVDALKTASIMRDLRFTGEQRIQTP